MSNFQSIVLGAVQGLTEFLPISSSGHLILFPWVLGWPDSGLAFDAFLHLGTIVAVLIYFFKDLCRLARGGFLSLIERKIGFDVDRLQFWLIVIGTIPGGLAGYFLQGYAETAFRSPLLIATTLSVVGFLLYYIDGKFPSSRSMDEISYKEAIWIGIAQACAIVPGVSRSGATMLMARLMGLTREASARFSFLLSFPIILAAGIFKGKDLLEPGQSFDPTTLALGFGSSCLVGLLAIHFLIQYLKRANFSVFAWYRIALGIFIIVFSLWSGR